VLSKLYYLIIIYYALVQNGNASNWQATDREIAGNGQVILAAATENGRGPCRCRARRSVCRMSTSIGIREGMPKDSASMDAAHKVGKVRCSNVVKLRSQNL
jgi:hypothetical protein